MIALGKVNINKDELNRFKVIERLINMWRNDPINTVRNSIENTLYNIYKCTQHPTVYKALKRYPDYTNNEIQEKYKLLFEQYPLSINS